MSACTSSVSFLLVTLVWPSHERTQQATGWTKFIQVQPKSCTCMKYLSSLSCRPGFKPCIRKVPCRREWQPTSVFLSRKSHGQRSLVVSSPGGGKESDTTEQVKLSISSSWLLWHIIKTGGASDYGSGAFLSRAKQVLLFFEHLTFTKSQCEWNLHPSMF